MTLAGDAHEETGIGFMGVHLGWGGVGYVFSVSGVLKCPMCAERLGPQASSLQTC